MIPDDLSLDGVLGNPVTTRGIAIPVGTSKTIEVDVFSDAPTAVDLQVVAVDVASQFGGGSAELTFAFDKATAHNGDKLQLTVTRAADGHDVGAGSEFVIAVFGTDHRPVSLWWGFAGN